MIWILLIWNLFAADVVIQGEKVSDLEYQQWVLKEPGKKTYISSVERGAPSKIKQELKRGQFHFLKGSLEKAKEHFKTMADLRLQEDWRLEERKAIHYALFRLAQLEKDPSLVNQYLLAALQFDDEIPVNNKLFPPPLVDHYQQLKHKHKIQVFTLPEGSQNFSEILMNGKKINNASTFFKARAGDIRLSFYSNKYRQVHLNTHTKNISTTSLQRTPLATGDCNNPQFEFPQSPSHRYSLHIGHCESSSMAALAPLNKLPVPPLGKPSNNRTKKFYKSTWFWAGVSVLVTGMALHHLEQQNRGGTASGAQPKQPREITN